MAKLDVEWLAVFLEIYRTKSVSKAAERLGMAQASASIALNKLRVHFGDRLFSRTARGMEPTPHASALYPQLSEVVARLDRARGSVARFDPASARRTFRICMADITQILVLPRLLNRLRVVAPHVDVETEPTGVASQERLEAGDVDLAVGFMPQLEAGFYEHALFEQDFVCIAKKPHPRLGKRLTRASFLAEGHIVVTSLGTGHAIADRTLAKKGFKRRVALRVPSFLGVARMVAQTELVVTVPRILAETFALQESLQIFEPPVRLPRFAIKLHWHERFNDDAGNAWLRRTISELFAAGRA
jgi:DNA-binding transcriptional LysR family regulator